MRFALQQSGNIVAVHFQANSLFSRNGVGLMRSLLEHGGEAEKLALRRLVDHDFLMVLVDGRDPHRAGDQDVRSSARIADLPDALARREGLDFDLCGQHRGLVVVEQGKQGNALSISLGCTPSITSYVE